jgi:catechol 2,3-dioxygenase-like lactoylglutathione lyase family enzyme
MINGAHVIVYSRDAEADRTFFKDVLEFQSVDAGRGWLIFALPPAEAAFHPQDSSGAAGDETNPKHELFLMCDDIHAETARLREKGVTCSEVSEQRWGSLVSLTMPSGGTLQIYQPKHPTAIGI